MARRTTEIRIPPEESNRDSGKLFVLTEMSAAAGFKWGMDALRALAKGGADVLPDDIRAPNMALIAGLGFRALSSVEGRDIDSLMDRLMACVAYYPNPAERTIFRVPDGLPPFESDIEEVSTHFLLRKEAFQLSAGFLLSAMKSKASETAAAPKF